MIVAVILGCGSLLFFLAGWTLNAAWNLRMLKKDINKTMTDIDVIRNNAKKSQADLVQFVEPRLISAWNPDNVH